MIDMRTVLIVEDYQELSSLLVEGLQLDGWNTATANSADEALKSARAITVDVVLCDMVLGGTSGLELEEMFRADTKLARIPFVFMTGLRDAARNVEPDRVLAKPFRFEAAYAALRRAIGRECLPFR